MTGALSGTGSERLGGGVTGAGVTGGAGRGVAGGGVAAGRGVASGFGCGRGVASGGFGRGVGGGSGAGVAGREVERGFGFGFGGGVALGEGVIGSVRISSRARRIWRFLSSSGLRACWPVRGAAITKSKARNRSLETGTRGCYAGSRDVFKRRGQICGCASALDARSDGVIVALMRPFLIRWFLTTIAVAVAAWITGIRFDTMGALMGSALLLGIVNAFIRPVLLLLSLPFILATLGLFILVVNAFLLWAVGSIVPGAHVDGFSQAFFGSLIVSFVSWLLSSFFRASDGRYHTIAHHESLKRVEGRVIDEPR